MTEIGYGWVYEPPIKHVCSPPLHDLRDHFEGALWRCQQCDQFWEVCYDEDAPQFKGMRMISPKDALNRMPQDVVQAVPGLQGRRG